MMLNLMRHFYDYLFVGIKENLAHLYEDRNNIDEILRQHTAIYEAIQAHDPDQAFVAMQKHIHFVLEFFRSR